VEPYSQVIGRFVNDLKLADVPPAVIEKAKLVFLDTLGIALALPEGLEAQLRPRSGLALRHGVTVLNAPGTIDSDYRGEVTAILINHGTEPFHVTRGMRIAQLVVAAHARIEWNETANLETTQRGARGFGSSGLNV